MTNSKNCADLSSLPSNYCTELLQFAQKSGIINIDDVRNEMTKNHKAQILKQHPHEIWQGKDTRWRTYLPDDTKPKGRRMIVKTDKEKLIDCIVAYYEGQDQSKKQESHTLESLYPEWLDYKKLHTTAPNYISRIDCDWKSYYLGTAIIKKPIRQYDKLTLDNWAHKLLQEHQLTKKQYYNATIIMRQTLEYAVDLGIIDSNPFSLVKVDGKRLFRKTKKKPDSTQVFTKEEFHQITMMAWEDFHNNTRLKHRLSPLAILFQFETGLRIGELCAIRYEDIEKSDYIHIQRMYRKETGEVVDHTKSACGDRKVLLTDTAKDIIETAKDFQLKSGGKSQEYIFSNDGKPLSTRSIDYLYTKYCKELGTIHKSSHKTRKTYISALIDGKVNLNTIREMVGHADERTTLNSYCFDRSADTEKENLIKSALYI